MAHVKTNRFSGNRAVRTLGAFTLGAAMTVGGLSFASAGDVQPTPNEVQALGYNTLIFQDEFTGKLLLRSEDALAGPVHRFEGKCVCLGGKPPFDCEVRADASKV